MGELRSFAGSNLSEAPSFGFPRSRTNGYPPTLGNNDLLNLVSFFTFSTIPFHSFTSFTSFPLSSKESRFHSLICSGQTVIHSFVHSFILFCTLRALALPPSIFLSTVYNFTSLQATHSPSSLFFFYRLLRSSEKEKIYTTSRLRLCPPE